MIKVPTETFAFLQISSIVIFSIFFLSLNLKTHEIYCSVLVVLVVFFWSNFFYTKFIPPCLYIN